MITFEYEYFDSIEEVIQIIQQCEDKHTQQVAYSTFHNCLTQVDWTDKKIRSNKIIQ
jgi:hypothetical protein